MCTDFNQNCSGQSICTSEQSIIITSASKMCFITYVCPKGLNYISHQIIVRIPPKCHTLCLKLLTAYLNTVAQQHQCLIIRQMAKNWCYVNSMKFIESHNFVHYASNCSYGVTNQLNQYILMQSASIQSYCSQVSPSSLDKQPIAEQVDLQC